MKTPILSAALVALLATAAGAEPVKYDVDASHAQILFSYDHLGYSTTWGMFSGFEGEILFDQANPENSSVEVSMPVTSMFTGWEKRFEHFMSDDFFGADPEAAEPEMVTFRSTGIEVTGEETALITGDLTLNGTTREVVLDTRLNKAAEHPMQNKPWAGFDATTTILRSDFGVGAFAPMVSDEVEIQISIEAGRADEAS